MARLSRVKIEGGGVYHHLYGRVAGPKDAYPLDNSMCRRRIIETIQLFSRVYCCSVIGFGIMANIRLYTDRDPRRPRCCLHSPHRWPHIFRSRLYRNQIQGKPRDCSHSLRRWPRILRLRPCTDLRLCRLDDCFCNPNRWRRRYRFQLCRDRVGYRPRNTRLQAKP